MAHLWEEGVMSPIPRSGSWHQAQDHTRLLAMLSCWQALSFHVDEEVWVSIH